MPQPHPLRDSINITGGIIMFEFLKDSIGNEIQVERGGPHSVSGKLVAIRNDFIVMENDEQEVVYIQSKHIKTITESILKDVKATQLESNDENHEDDENYEDDEKYENYENSPTDTTRIETLQPIIDAADLMELLSQLKHRMVRIDGTVEGVVLSINEDFITLLQGKEFQHIPIYHMKSLTVLYKKVGAEKEKHTKENEKESREDLKSSKADK
jgi:spore coat protein B